MAGSSNNMMGRERKIYFILKYKEKTPETERLFSGKE